jgi:hypothetical protein
LGIFKKINNILLEKKLINRYAKINSSSSTTVCSTENSQKAICLIFLILCVYFQEHFLPVVEHVHNPSKCERRAFPLLSLPIPCLWVIHPGTAIYIHGTGSCFLSYTAESSRHLMAELIPKEALFQEENIT